jgi:hypothetical protein
MAFRGLPVRWLKQSVGSLVFVAVSSGCAEAYCQSGPKYGTQCYSINEIEWQETQVRSEPAPGQWSTKPAPGCVLATPQGYYRQPLPGAAGSGGTPPAAYLASGACFSRRVPAHGAVR